MTTNDNVMQCPRGIYACFSRHVLLIAHLWPNVKSKCHGRPIIFRKVVDQAKVLIMLKEGLDEVSAYRQIQKISMNNNKPLKAVAEAIILRYGE